MGPSESQSKPTGKNIVKIVTEICKKLSASELEYLLSVCETEFSDKVCELLHNTCLHGDIFKKLERVKRFKNLHESLKADKSNILRILNTRSSQRRRHLLKRQAGSGIITGDATFLAMMLPGIIAAAKATK